MTKTMSWASAQSGRPLSATLLHFAAATLMTASALLTRLAVRMSATEAIRVPVQTVEFHPIYRESGAPEGALYINGELVGVIEGVTRL